nr:uncharacterized protein LOC123765088 [Procambarus clarkii]
MVESCGKTRMVCFPLALLVVGLAATSANLNHLQKLSLLDSIRYSLLGPEDVVNTTLLGQDDDMTENVEDSMKRVSNGKRDVLLAEGGGGREGNLKTERETQESLEATCNCLKLKTATASCFGKLEEMGPLVINGRCIGGNMWRRRRERGRADVNDFPILVHADREMCEGSKPLIFSSSGEKSRLTFGNTPSILICQGSIGPHLENLSISGVKEIWVAPGALQPRDAKLVIHLSDVQNKIILPEGALLIEASESNNHEQQSPPAEIHFIIERATSVEYNSQSLVAPRISVVMDDVRNISIGPQAIIAYKDAKASFFEARLSESLLLETRAMRVGNFKAIDIDQLTLKEASVDVTTDGGGEMILEGVKNLVLEDNAVRLSPGASLTLNNVNISSAGHRAISNYINTTGPLLNVNLHNVNGTTLANGAFCLVSENVILNIFTVWEQPETTSTCIQAETLSSDTDGETWPGVVTCQGLNETSPLCGDARCAPCTILPLVGSTTDMTETYEEGLPLYAVVLTILAGIILILLLIFSICKILRRNQSAEYKLPRPAQNNTFQKSIVTAENLDTSCKNTREDHAAPAEIYITFNKSEPLEERQVLLSDVDLFHTDFHTLPANAYLPSDNTRRISEDYNCS